MKPIPGMPGFSISEDGHVFDSEGKERNYYVNGDGYRTVCVKNALGKNQTYGGHRLVAMTYIEPPGDIKLLTVNHRDKNKENNHYLNLEWISSGLNNIHAALLSGKSSVPKLIVEKNNEGKYLSSIDDALEYFGCTWEELWDAVKNGTEIAGAKLSYLKGRDRIPFELRKPPTHNARRDDGWMPKRSLRIKDLESNEIKRFLSIFDAACYFGVSPSHIFQCISKHDKVKLFKRKYLIADDENDFPIVTSELLELLRNPTGKEVVAFNIKTLVFAIFSSASSFIKEHKLSKKAVTVALRNERLRVIDDWLFTYNTPALNEKLKQAICCLER